MGATTGHSTLSEAVTVNRGRSFGRRVVLPATAFVAVTLFASAVAFAPSGFGGPAEAEAQRPSVQTESQDVTLSAEADLFGSLDRDPFSITAPPTPTPEVSAEEDASGVFAPPAGNPSPGSSKAIAAKMIADRGWGSEHFNCLVALWNKESGWNARAHNRSSGAYGIPQALPGSKMASAGADWASNPATQIKWGLGYIQGRYKTPCGAYSFFQSRGWY